MQVMGLVSGSGGRALIICHWFVIEFWRQEAVVGATRRWLAAPWREADQPQLNSDGGPLKDGRERVKPNFPARQGLLAV